ncbi:metal ABC transporter permease [Terasakiella sp. SH-1]|uniref:metal ABC transporter permease n=1 Tax=Terasakiella sp. SH-1 TaxID=2560057 RepID=UPI00320A6549
MAPLRNIAIRKMAITTMKPKRKTMLDDFFMRALIAGVGLAIVAGPLGCFVVWRRMAYFGDTMAHSALLGVALSFLFDISLMAGVFGVACLVSLLLVGLQKRKSLPTDALLGILSHSALAIGLVLVSLMAWLRIDLMGYLFGDILSVSRDDILLIYGGGVIILAILSLIWRSLLAGSVSEELAIVEGLHPQKSKLVFMLLMAGVVAIAIKLVGILLITALLIIPAATARRFASGPEMMAVFAALIGGGSVIGGLYASLEYDTPSGPSIVMMALIFFLLSLLPLFKGRTS